MVLHWVELHAPYSSAVERETVKKTIQEMS